jgi:phosphoribosylformimino-5-aminoimidazole carboxamide ribotide isomerase
MRIIPVLDIKADHVVRGIAGRREEYRPITSSLTRSTSPLDVARAFVEQLGLGEFYVADLDAIAGAAPALATYEGLQRLGARLWVDAGVRTVEDAVVVASADVDTIVIGLETIAGPQVLAEICERFGNSRVLFSLDLKDCFPLGAVEQWNGRDAMAIASQAHSAGVRRVLVLDLARVGMGQGNGTTSLCNEIARRHPEVELVAGGGIRDANDLRALRKCGVRAVLVASALHDGRLKPADWAEF